MSMSFFGDIREEKSALRKHYKSLRAEYTQDHKSKLDNKIANKTVNLWKFRESDIILCYVSFGIEVDTHIIIETALEQGKRVAVPRCIDGTREIDFYFINSLDDLSPGTFGVLEPKKNDENKVVDFSTGLCIVPALSLDAGGFRLGFGKGYYDRFLSKYRATIVGLCYSDCVVEKLPHGKHDKSVDILITEKSLFTINNR